MKFFTTQREEELYNDLEAITKELRSIRFAFAETENESELKVSDGNFRLFIAQVKMKASDLREKYFMG